jgi:hypothetical protein
VPWYRGPCGTRWSDLWPPASNRHPHLSPVVIPAKAPLLSGISPPAGVGSVAAQLLRGRYLPRRLQTSTHLVVIPAKAGGAFRQTNVWSYIDGDAPAAGVTAGRIAETVAPGRRARIYSGQQWAKAGIALQPHSKTTCRPRLPLALHAGQSDVLLTPAKRACQPFASPPPAAPGECRQGPRSRIRQRPVRHRQVTGLTRQIGTKLAAVNAGRPFRCAQPGNAANSPGTCLLDRADKPPPGVIRGGRPHTAPGLRVRLRVAPGAKPPPLPAQRGRLVIGVVSISGQPTGLGIAPTAKPQAPATPLLH